MMVGFRLSSVKPWNITADDPTLWVKLCDETVPDLTNNFPDSDPLYGRTIVLSDVVQSVLDEVNNLEMTYLKLELYPTDPNNPPAGSTFTTDKATNRTITYCSGGVGFGAVAGYSKYKVDGKNRLIACEITIKTKYDNIRQWTATFTHELGHCMGLDHPHESVNAIMSYFEDSKVYRYQIDDLMGIAHLYPNPDLDLKETNTYGLKCSFKK